MYTTPVIFYRLVQRKASNRAVCRWQLLTCRGYEFDLDTQEPLEPDILIDFWRSQARPGNLWDEFVVYHFTDTWGFLNSGSRVRYRECDDRILTKIIRDGMRYHTRYPMIINGDETKANQYMETMSQELLEKYGHGTPPAESGWPHF